MLFKSSGEDHWQTHPAYSILTAVEKRLDFPQKSQNSKADLHKDLLILWL
jgi:hypothetical protein